MSSRFPGELRRKLDEGFGLNVNASVGADQFNRPFAPGKSEQIEIGAKAEWFEGRLLTTLALYNLTKTNIPVRDITSLDPTAVVLVGAARSRGVELDATGKIFDNLSLISSFTYMDARVTKDNNTDPATTTLGRRLIGVPRYQGSFWAKWDIKEIYESMGSVSGLACSWSATARATIRAPSSCPAMCGLMRWPLISSRLWATR